MSASPSGVAPRRRNGRLQACNPCRRRKVACDHTLPVCTRCGKRNTPNSCVYVVQDNVLSRSLGFSPATSSTDSSSAPRPRSSIIIGSRAGPSEITLDIEALEPLNTQSGYLGATSFSAVFQETQNHLSAPDSNIPSTDSPSVHTTTGETEISTSTTCLDKETLHMAVNVLASIPEEAPAHEYFFGELAFQPRY